MTESVAEVIVPALDALEITREMVNACSEARGKDITVLDVSKIFDLANHFIIVSGRSDRQVQGIANKVVAALENLGMEPVSMEGYEDGHWVLLDYGDVIMHIFYEPLRSHYDIEGLWARAKRLDAKKILGEPVQNAA